MHKVDKVIDIIKDKWVAMIQNSTTIERQVCLEMDRFLTDIITDNVLVNHLENNFYIKHSNAICVKTSFYNQFKSLLNQHLNQHKVTFVDTLPFLTWKMHIMATPTSFSNNSMYSFSIIEQEDSDYETGFESWNNYYEPTEVTETIKTIKCDCGAEKVKTTHAFYCSTRNES